MGGRTIYMWGPVITICVALIFFYFMLVRFISNAIIMLHEKLLEGAFDRHNAIVELFQASAHLMIKLSGATIINEEQDSMSMQCPYMDKNDPDKTKCKNENNTTGKCETMHCPLLH